jgi:hypothetical protein
LNGTISSEIFLKLLPCSWIPYHISWSHSTSHLSSNVFGSSDGAGSCARHAPPRATRSSHFIFSSTQCRRFSDWAVRFGR